MLQAPSNGKNAQRSLQHHVTHSYADHQGDWRELIGDKLVHARRGRTANRQGVADNNEAQSNVSASSTSPAGPRSQTTPVPTLSPRKETESHPVLLNQGESLESSDFDLDDLRFNYSILSQAQHARSKANKILQSLQDDEKATISMDEWDQAAVNGQKGRSIDELAQAAFPDDMFYDEFTVCLTSDESVIGNSAQFFLEKAARFEVVGRGLAK